ncbi:MAG: hypothetical protein ABMA13_23790, partial [Chthoniobacteraceae bacterium]
TSARDNAADRSLTRSPIRPRQRRPTAASRAAPSARDNAADRSLTRSPIRPQQRRPTAASRAAQSS